MRCETRAWASSARRQASAPPGPRVRRQRAHAPAATGTACTALRACRETARNACGGRRTVNATRNGVYRRVKVIIFSSRDMYGSRTSDVGSGASAAAKTLFTPDEKKPITRHIATGNRTSHPANLLAAWRRFHDHPQEGLTPCRLPSCFVFCDHTRMPSCFVFCDPPEGGFFLFLGAVFGRRRAEGLAEGREAHAK